jgi:hypothetical protein
LPHSFKISINRGINRNIKKIYILRKIAEY